MEGGPSMWKAWPWSRDILVNGIAPERNWLRRTQVMRRTPAISCNSAVAIGVAVEVMKTVPSVIEKEFAIGGWIRVDGGRPLLCAS
jgi:hypothetical protein